MSSSTNNPHQRPLPEGNYFLVDISEATSDYMRSPEHVRQSGLGIVDSDFTPIDTLDIELSSILPCIDDYDTAERELNKHIQEILEHQIEERVLDMSMRGQSTEGRQIPNSPEELEHAQTLRRMGLGIRDALKAHAFYDENGGLTVEHCSLRDDGSLVVRANTRKQY